MTDASKRAAVFLAEVGKQTETSLADGFQARDLIDYLDEALKGPQFAKDMPVAIKEWKAGFTEQERTDLVQHVKVTLDLQDDLLESKIEAGFEWLAASEKFFHILMQKPAA